MIHSIALLTMDFRDAFAGGFVSGIVEGKSLEQSVDQGHWLAHLSIKELGPQYVSIPATRLPTLHTPWHILNQIRQPMLLLALTFMCPHACSEPKTDLPSPDTLSPNKPIKVNNSQRSKSLAR